jgi:hypothetical protein
VLNEAKDNSFKLAWRPADAVVFAFPHEVVVVLRRSSTSGVLLLLQKTFATSMN